MRAGPACARCDEESVSLINGILCMCVTAEQLSQPEVERHKNALSSVLSAAH